MKKIRCHWANPKNPLYLQYHDEEWGIPVHDDHKLFEMLILESFQAGLSWECILNKREAFRQAFDEFDLETVCGYGEEKLAELGQSPGIVRNKLKIRAAVNNARIFRTIQQEWGSFDRYLWHWTEGKTIYETGKVSSELSDAVSKDLKRRGMKFVSSQMPRTILKSHTPKREMAPLSMACFTALAGYWNSLYTEHNRISAKFILKREKTRKYFFSNTKEK